MKSILYASVAIVCISPALAGDSFDSSSDGYSWRSASIGYRRAYCNVAATNVQHLRPGITGKFLFDALQEFYTTDNPKLLRQKINEIIALSVTAYGS
jgi:hypothetical protein